VESQRGDRRDSPNAFSIFAFDLTAGKPGSIPFKRKRAIPMGNAAAKAGWLIFLFAVAGAALHTGPDDPLTAGLKSSGVYRPYVIITCSIIVFALIRTAFIMHNIVALHRQLDELRRRKGKG
jgi:hypothetical protein